MKLIAVFLMMSLVISCQNKPSGEFNFELYSQNDVHGRFFDSLYVGNTEHKSSMANIAQIIKDRRAAIGKENIILIDNGDHLQGDNASYYFNYIEKPASTADTTKLHLFSRIMNYLNFDAVVVGNHDIETGHAVYDRIVKELKMPYLAANAIKTDGSGSYFKPYTILNKNGVKIAIIGMTNANIKKWLASSLWKGMDFVSIDKIADSLVNEIIKKENPHMIIMAMHSGLGDATKENYENQARYLAANIKNVDLFLSAHDHLKTCEKIWNGSDSVLLLTGGSKAEFLSKANIQMVLKNGKVISKKISGSVIDLAGTPKDTAYLNIFRDDFLKVKNFTNTKIGEIPHDVVTIDALFGPSDYMNIVHYVQLQETGADISFAAPLTFNSVIEGGEITYQDLFTIYPYENQLYTITLTGKQIKNYLEFSYNTWVQTMKSKGDHIMNIAYNNQSGRYNFKNFTFNFDSGAGINYKVDVTKPFGEKIEITSLSNGEKFSEDATYKVAISSYRANGGGDILEKGAGISPNQFESLITGRYSEIRDLIYKYFSADSLKMLPDNSNWKFVPESYTYSALKRDRALLSGSVL